MSVITFRLPADKHERLRHLAQRRGISVNRLLDELTTVALTQNDVEAQFRAAAARGSKKKALAVLGKIDRHFGTARASSA